MHTIQTVLKLPFGPGIIVVKDYTPREWGRPPQDDEFAFDVCFLREQDTVRVDSLRDLWQLSSRCHVNLRQEIAKHLAEYEELFKILAKQRGSPLRPFMIQDLENWFGLARSLLCTRVEGSKFFFVYYTQWIPNITLYEITVDLDTMEIGKHELLRAEHPRSAAEG